MLRTTVLLSFFALLASGCAGVLKSGKGSTTLISDPPNATVRINGSERGTTPFTYSYEPADGKQVQFEVQATGYQKSTLTVRPKQNNMVLFVDAMLLQLPTGMDKKNPSMYYMPLPTYTVQLYKEMPADMERVLLPVVGSEVDLGGAKHGGTINKKPLPIGTDATMRDLKDEDQVTSAIVAGLRETWVDARSIRRGTTKGDEAIQRAKTYLRPKVKAINATLTGTRKNCHGLVVMEIEWNFYSGQRSDSVIYSKVTNTTYQAMGANSVHVVDEAIRHAARLLAEDEGLAKRLSTNASASVLAGRGDEIRLKTPAAIAFEGRKDMLAALVKAVVTITTSEGHGSGFMISNDGYLITNAHVVGKESKPKVKFEQGFTLEAQVVKVNKDVDLALLKVPATDLPALKIGDDAGLMLGEELFAIGTPLDASLGQSVSRGVLSGKREIEGRTFLQTDVTINPGNSGGPFIDETGSVVGMATMKISGKGLEGLGFGVPISVILNMLNITIAP